MPTRLSLSFFLWIVVAVAVLLLFAVPALSQRKSGASAGAEVSAANPSRVAVNYGRIPMSFEANRGQTDPSIEFLSRGQGYTLFLRPDEAVLALRGATPTGTNSERLDPRSRVAPKLEDVESSVVRMKFVGANPRAAAREEEEQITKTNYFFGNDPSKWRTDIPNYGRVRYSGIYPGIDLVYYGSQSQLEHDFVVAPGADPACIRLSVIGAGKSRIDPVSGDLVMRIGQDELRLLKPVAYQQSNGRRTSVPSRYKLLAQNEVGLTIARFDRARPLIIDPVLVYSSFLGGSGSKGHGDQGNGIVLDSAGDAYVVGTTYSTNFPITTDAFDSQNNSALAGTGGTVFVSELNPSGTELIYSTYLGGSGGDFGFGIAIDSTNNIYLAGATYSKDFPVTCGTFQTQNPTQTPGASVGFVAKLNRRWPPVLLVSRWERCFCQWQGVWRCHPSNRAGYKRRRIPDRIHFFAELSWRDFRTYPLVPNVGGAAASKYSVMTVAGTLTVKPAGLTVTISPATATRLYGYPNPAFTVKETGLVNGDTLSISDPATESSPVGKYVVTIAGPTLSDYILTVNNAILAVKPAPLTVTLSPATASRAYGAPNPTFTFRAEGLRNNDILSISDPATSRSRVGTYVVTVTGLRISNYDASVHTAVLTITPAPLTVTMHPVVRPYGSPNFANNVFSYSGTFPVSQFYLNGSARITTHALNLTRNVEDPVGTAYFKTPMRIGSFDTIFTFQFPGNPFGGMTFVLQNQGPTALGQAGGGLGYGATSPAGPLGITPSAAIKFDTNQEAANGNDSSGLYTDGASPTNPGISVVSSGLQLGSEHVFQAELSYDGKNLLERVTDTQTNVSFYHAYPVNLPAILGAKTAWAGFTASGGRGDRVTNVLRWSYSDSPVPYSITGLVNGEGVIVDPETAATTASHVGSYPLTATVTGNALANYALTVVKSSLTVAPAPLTIKAVDLTIQQGQPIPKTFAYTVTGFVLNQNKSVVSGAPVLSTTATSTSPAGTYPIVVKQGTLAARNYSFREVNGTMTIQ
jgi:hypothetical protein